MFVGHVLPQPGAVIYFGTPGAKIRSLWITDQFLVEHLMPFGVEIFAYESAHHWQR